MEERHHFVDRGRERGESAEETGGQHQPPRFIKCPAQCQRRNQTGQESGDEIDGECGQRECALPIRFDGRVKQIAAGGAYAAAQADQDW